MIPLRLTSSESGAREQALAGTLAGGVSVPRVNATNDIDMTGVFVVGIRRVSATAQTVKNAELHR